MKKIFLSLSFIFLFFAGIFAGFNVEQAVSFLQSVRPELVKQEQQQEVGQKIDEAWDVIKKSNGLEKLKAAADADKGNDYFRLNACALAWQLRGVKEADFIARIWERTDLSANYQYVFYTACMAAEKMDKRVEPMLLAVLKDTKGKLFIDQHSLEIEYPLSHQIIWGIYGPKGGQPLENALKESKDTVVQSSAIRLLTKMQDAGALESIRAIASDSANKLSYEAIASLGEFGRPGDLGIIEEGIKRAKDNGQKWFCAFAIYEYGNTSLVPALMGYLKSRDKKLSMEAASGLLHLVTPEGIEALDNYAGSGTDTKQLKKALEDFFTDIGTTGKAYKKLSFKQKEALCEKYNNSVKNQYALKPDDKPVSRRQMLDILREMKSKGKITLEKYEWLQDRHVISALTPEDIPTLLELKAEMYRRLSDECLGEVSYIDRDVKALGRRIK